jgi:hypothetical protein
LRIKATNKKNHQFVEAVVSCRSFICPRARNGSGDGAIEVLTVERLRFRRQAQRKGYEDRN